MTTQRSQREKTREKLQLPILTPRLTEILLSLWDRLPFTVSGWLTFLKRGSYLSKLIFLEMQLEIRPVLLSFQDFWIPFFFLSVCDQKKRSPNLSSFQRRVIWEIWKLWHKTILAAGVIDQHQWRCCFFSFMLFTKFLPQNHYCYFFLERRTFSAARRRSSVFLIKCRCTCSQAATENNGFVRRYVASWYIPFSFCI